MSAAVFARGRRLCASGCVALLIVAGLHFLGQFSTPPPGSELAVARAFMANARVPMGLGMAPSVLDITSSISLTMSILLLALGVTGLVLLRAAGDHPLVPRRIAQCYAVFIGALVVLYAAYHVPPPLVTLAVVEVLFLLALGPHRTAA